MPTLQRRLETISFRATGITRLASTKGSREARVATQCLRRHIRPHHTSGIAEPSHADEALTKALKQALTLVDCKVLDHFSIAGTGHVSFAERGLMQKGVDYLDPPAP